MQWDWRKYNMRKESIQYDKAKARQRKERISSIEHNLKLAEEELAESPSVDNLNRLKNIENRM